MDLNFFNVMVRKDAYEGNEEMQNGLRQHLLDCGVAPLDVREADIQETATGKTVLSVLVIKCLEMQKCAKELFRMFHPTMEEIDYEGLPTLV